MALSNAERQRRITAKRRERGLVFVQRWVSAEQAVAIAAYLSGLAYLTVRQAPGGASARVRRNTRGKTVSSEQLAELARNAKNHEVIEKHRAKIAVMERSQVKRTEIRIFLEKAGADFGGSTLALNALLGPRVRPDQ